MARTPSSPIILGARNQLTLATNSARINEVMIFLVVDAYLVQGFDSFSGDSLTYDINNDKVLVKGSEDGTKRVKFKIDL